MLGLEGLYRGYESKRSFRREGVGGEEEGEIEGNRRI